MNMDVNSMYPEKPFIRYDLYKRHILGIFNNEDRFEFLVGGRGCGRMAMMRYDEDFDNVDVHILYKTTWSGKEVSTLTSSHIINILLKLEREVLKNKTAFEIYLLDFKEDELIKTKYDLLEIAKMSPKDWLESLPIYKKLMEELSSRNLKAYYDIVKARKETENE